MNKLQYPECLLDINLKAVGKFNGASSHANIECLECGKLKYEMNK